MSASQQSLVNTANDDGAADGNMINILIDKFSQEIERLKADNAQLKLQRDNVTQFYKDEFSRLW